MKKSWIVLFLIFPLMLSGAISCIKFVTSNPTEFPEINTFKVSQSSISAGETATLAWNVSGAQKVSIEPGIGNVALEGSRAVSPTTTTTYTLTATAENGKINIATVQITVAEGTASATTPPAGSTPTPTFLPPLTTLPPIATLPPTTTTPPITTLPPVYTLPPLGTLIPLPPASVFYNFVDNAMSAYWINGSSVDLGFGIVQEDGFARLHTNQLLDDGNTYPKVLETHPQWINHGAIHGYYPMITIPSGAKFNARLGFLSGAIATDGVIFWLTWTQFDSHDTASFPAKNVFYSGALDTYEVNLASYAGQYGQFGLHVEAGASSGQDWAVWAEAKLTQ